MEQANAERQVPNEMEFFFEILHTQRKIWISDDRNVNCWAFYCVNDDKKVDTRNLQVMRCLLCYNRLVHAC